MPDARGLTEGERATILLALAGSSNQQISVARGVSPHTVANQLTSAYRKLRVTSRRELRAKWSRLPLEGVETAAGAAEFDHDTGATELLSLREKQVLDFARSGYANKVIGPMLGIATSTVSTLLTRARRKLGSSGASRSRT